MPTPTYTALAKTVLSTSQSTVTFSGIVNSYTDLILLISCRSNLASIADNLSIRLNGSTSTVNSWTNIQVQASTVYSNRNQNFNRNYLTEAFSAANATANTFGSIEIYLPNYAGSNNKVFSTTGVVEDNATGTYMGLTASLWRDNTAVSSITLFPESGPNFVSGSRFDLYGIKNS